jgi:IrrE N-terminal-like domain
MVRRGCVDMDRAGIEQEARSLLAQIWRRSAELFPMGAPKPKGMLEPEIAAQALGFSYEISDGLGSWGQGQDRFEIAGLLDCQRHAIVVSNKFRYPTMRFTGAHEVGHLVLKHPGRVLHRDRPVFQIDGGYRDPIEQEADYFAACFLAPAKLVDEAFQARFVSRPPLPLTDAVAFNLCGESSHALMRAGPASFKFASAVATAQSFNGRRFESLANLFGLSVGAMAIRLRELRLI